jgi:cysteine desulfurase
MRAPWSATDDLIYLDYNATTPVAPRVLESMLPWFRERPGNAASTHAAGRLAAAAVHRAREQVASTLGVSRNEILFTSGATEANNLVLRGVTGRIVVAATEHKSVLETAQDLGDERCTVVPVQPDGRIDVKVLKAVLPGSSLVSVMTANNETGVLQDLRTIVSLAEAHGCLVHTDATQALGKIPVDLRELGVHFASFSAHKVYGPKGIGALYVRRGVSLRSTMTGGGHEGGIRSGTLNVPGIVGFGMALESFGDGSAHLCASRTLTSRLLDRLLVDCAPVQVYSDHESGLPNTLSVRFVGADAEATMANCPRVAMSVGSACTAAVPAPSHVLLAMGIAPRAASETVRLSLGRETTEAEIDAAATAIGKAVGRVRIMTSDRGADMVGTTGMAL